VTLDDLAQMVRNDKDFVVYDAKSGDDLTHAVLTQIIVEQESRQGGQTLLPIPFLRQLIRFYDDNIGSMVPSYLQFSLENLVKEQEKFRSMFANAFANPAAAFEAYQDQARKNMAMFEQAMNMWTSFGGAANLQAKRDEAGEDQAQAAGGADAPKGEIDELKAQLSAMQQRIERLAKGNE
jgi:polyhydroxyalkanoate synthesis repressor PhaR